MRHGVQAACTPGGVGLSVPNFESDTHTLCGPVYRRAWFHSAPISKLRAVIEGACST